MYEKLLRFSRSRLSIALGCVCVFLVLLLCNHFTDLIADDYRYCFSFADGSRIERVGQIVPSMSAHRQSMNGRVVPHALVQLFLMLPKSVFDVVNALFFTALVWLLHRLAVASAPPEPLLFLTILGSLWIFQPDFGQVFLWLDGSVNYLWCAVFSLVWLLPLIRSLREDREPGPALRLLYVLFSFPLGAYSENGTVALVAMWLALALLERLLRGRKPRPWRILSLLSMLGGFFYMMSAPAESVNKSAEMTFPVLLANLGETARYYLRFWPLLLCFALFYALALRRGVGPEERLLALVLLFGSLSGHFVLTFAMYTAGRSTYISLVLLIAADAVLFARLFELPGRGLPLLLSLVCALCFLWRFDVGFRDIRDTHALLQYNEAFIAACAANGEREVELWRPYAKTSYSALEGLPYLNTENPDDWPNVHMAKYYGVDRVIAY